jgi:hypothetical protein
MIEYRKASDESGQRLSHRSGYDDIAAAEPENVPDRLSGIVPENRTNQRHILHLMNGHCQSRTGPADRSGDTHIDCHLALLFLFFGILPHQHRWRLIRISNVTASLACHA